MAQPLHRSAQLAAVAVLPILLTLSLAPVTSAHRPLFANTDASHPDAALRIPDPSVSHVVYAELTDEHAQKWFVFQNEKPREVPIKVGIPAAVSQGEFRPTVVLFGPGWPEPSEDLPYSPPQAEPVGAFTLPTVDRSHRFYEPVTGTESHIVVDTQVRLPEAGIYYGVVYEPNGLAGKVWIGLGSSEGFSWRDAARLPGWIGEVRRFHEVSGWPRWAWMSTLGVLAVVLVGLVWWRLRR